MPGDTPISLGPQTGSSAGEYFVSEETVVSVDSLQLGAAYSRSATWRL